MTFRIFKSLSVFAFILISSMSWANNVETSDITLDQDSEIMILSNSELTAGASGTISTFDDPPCFWIHGSVRCTNGTGGSFTTGCQSSWQEALDMMTSLAGDTCGNMYNLIDISGAGEGKKIVLGIKEALN